MESIKNSLSPIFNTYRIEIILLMIAAGTALFSAVILLKERPVATTDSSITISRAKTNPSEKVIHVDIEGAVRKPGVYKLNSQSRLQDIIAKAGGITGNADKYYFARNFNLASVLKDEQKIYIPAVEESRSTGDNMSGDSPENLNASLININTATRAELDSLAGVGGVTADKIISSRPYNSVEELMTKKILKTSVYESIKDKLTP